MIDYPLNYTIISTVKPNGSGELFFRVPKWHNEKIRPWLDAPEYLGCYEFIYVFNRQLDEHIYEYTFREIRIK